MIHSINLDGILVELLDRAAANILRSSVGYGVTVWMGEGTPGQRLIMQVIVKRNNE